MSKLLRIMVCPGCQGELAEAGTGVRCSACGTTYPVLGGIPCFSNPDPFYDEYAETHCPFEPTPKGAKAAILRFLPFWSYREWRFWRSVVPRGGRLLDLGAGAGKEVFIEQADEIFGLDASLAFLQECRKHYDGAVLSSSAALPFETSTFDTVVSSHVFGHIHADAKEELVREIGRVLRPGGTTAHIIETDSEHPAVKRAKTHPEIYRSEFVEQDGHIGLEPVSEVVSRFERHGLRLAFSRLVGPVVTSVMHYEKYFSHSTYRDLPELRTSRLLKRLNESGRLGNLLYECGFGVFHYTAEQWFGNPARASFLLASFRKQP